MRLAFCAPALVGIAMAIPTLRQAQHQLEVPLLERGRTYENRLPLVLDGKIPRYPQLALAARIDGTVLMRVSVDRGVVHDVEVESGNPILAEAAKDNVMGWRFLPETTEVIGVQYVFEISDEEANISPINPEIVLRLPSYVKIVADRVKSPPVGNN
jgi:TonB family protein